MRRRISKTDSMTYRTGYRGGAALFSLPFIGSGTYFALVGFEYLPPPSNVNAPSWVVGFVGIAFAMAGVLVLVHALRGMRHHARRKRVIELYPDRPWVSDYPWDQNGIDSRLGARALHSIFGATLFCVFLAPFHWWAWMSDQGGLIVKLITGLFEFIAVFVVWSGIRHVLQWLKYGRMRLRWRQFPFEPGGKIDIEFSPNRFDQLRATLRFIEERMETSGSGDNRSTRLVHDALYEESRDLTPGPLQPEVRIELDLPANDEWVNAISGTPVRYWELHLEAEVGGVDFEASWPLPVYAGRRKATAPRGGKVTVME
ncbi:MAG: hypothetical protein ACYTHK_16530 [Planctomycetota bacterium]